MLCTLEELRQKEVIDISTGERLGYIDDIEIDTDSGTVEKIIIYGSKGIFGLFGKEDDVVINCGDIKVIGSDVILAERKNMPNGAGLTKIEKRSSESLLR